MSGALRERFDTQLDAPVDPAVREFAQALAWEAGASAVLFYGSNLRTGSLEGVLDFYVLLPGTAGEEPRIWPTISYHERVIGGSDRRGVAEGADLRGVDEGADLRAKVATMRLETFAKAASGELRDTTIWARFVQPCACVWSADKAARAEVLDAIEAAAITAARLAVALGPHSGTAQDYWGALFRATYKAEFRVEKPGRENDILSVNAAHFAGMLPQALEAAGIAFEMEEEWITPRLSDQERSEMLNWWSRRKRMGKPLNLVRLMKASTTFEGAARYAAWKIERHTGMAVTVTPFRERYPLLAAPGVLWSLWNYRRGGGTKGTGS
ncbi:MAG: hypothetical protein WBA51_00740 [Erythrobacter sp.]